MQPNLKRVSERVSIEIDESQVKKQVDQSAAEVKTVLKRKAIKKTAVSVVVPAPKKTVIKKRRVFGNKKHP